MARTSSMAFSVKVVSDAMLQCFTRVLSFSIRIIRGTKVKLPVEDDIDLSDVELDDLGKDEL
ncbi:hypothetical protein P7K49_028513 [Saguinus oedipus]|uniref:Uncharacterized protein n=1 Tax=Saguinus oedipus TaxID=9490 RepID=A0ABQ9U4J4_SAGOE|nr:hypothetical protein P7K49_028513 [Saguinus oedipus]